MLRKIAIYTLFLPLSLSACANPKVVEYGTTGPMACNNITRELSEAKQALADSHKEDKFKLQYILIAPAIVSVYRMDKAERAAKNRIEELEAAYKRQACSPYKAVVPEQPGSFPSPYQMQPSDQVAPMLNPINPPAPVYSVPPQPLVPQQPNFGTPSQMNQAPIQPLFPQQPGMQQQSNQPFVGQQPGQAPIQPLLPQQSSQPGVGYQNNGQMNPQLLQPQQQQRPQTQPLPLWQQIPPPTGD